MVDGKTFGEYYYGHDCGIPYERSEHWTNFFGRIAEHIIRDLKPTTALDAGCAIGLLVEQLRNRGVDAEGVDISDYAHSQMPDEVRKHCWVASLTEPIDKKYDLVTCIEVVEHMPASEVRAAIANLCSVTDRVLLSSSPYDYGEPTHLNVQQPEYWSSLMAANGFVRDFDYDASYLTPWATLYVRHPGGVAEIVRDYDRAWWHLHQEVKEVRAKVLDLQEQLGDPDLLQVRKEQQALQEEILRLRDELIGREAELGGARGRIAELEATLQRYDGMQQRLEAILGSRSWRLMWAAGTPVRKLRQPGS
ncbi:MAG TPA: methyltransferase domain-containing protein [Acidimicrobiales bacterium]